MVASVVRCWFVGVGFVLQEIANDKKRLEKRSSLRVDKTVEVSRDVRVRAVKLLMMMTMMQRMEDASPTYLYTEPCLYQTCHYQYHRISLQVN
jgi:hypothetical protein